MSGSELILQVLGYELPCKYFPDKEVTCSPPKQTPLIIQLSGGTPLVPPLHFHIIPLQTLLAALQARLKQFSNKLFAFVGIRFQLFLCFPFVVGSDCLSEFPHSLRENDSLELTTPLKYPTRLGLGTVCVWNVGPLTL